MSFTNKSHYRLTLYTMLFDISLYMIYIGFIYCIILAVMVDAFYSVSYFAYIVDVEDISSRTTPPPLRHASLLRQHKNCHTTTNTISLSFQQSFHFEEVIICIFIIFLTGTFNAFEEGTYNVFVTK